MKKNVLISAALLSSITLVNFASAAEPVQADKAVQAKSANEKDCKMQLGIEVRAWFPEICGQETRSSKLDFQNDLGHKGKEVTNVKLNLAENSKWRGNYESYTFNGNKTAHSSTNFGGQSYIAGEGLTSEKNLTYWNINYLPEFQSAGQKNFSWLIGLKGYKINSLVSKDTGNLRAQQSYNAVLPAVGARYEVRKSSATVYYAELSGSSNLHKGCSYDVEFGLQHKLSPNAVFSGGYRCLYFDVEKNNSDLNMHLYGPFVELNCKL